MKMGMKKFLVKSLVALLILTILLLPLPFSLGSVFEIRSDPPPTEYGYLYPPGITTNVLPMGEVGQAYAVTFDTTSVYASTLVWFIEDVIRGIPPGLGIYPSDMRGPTLTLLGTPYSSGSFIFEVRTRETFLNGADERFQYYEIPIRPSPEPPPPPDPIDYSMRIFDGTTYFSSYRIDYNLTRIATGELPAASTGPYQLILEKIGGSSELIRLEQVGLPAGVDMHVGEVLVRSPTQSISENLFLDDRLTFDLFFSVLRDSPEWIDLAGPRGAPRSHIVFIRANSTSGVEHSVQIELNFFYTPPFLQILTLEPVTQQISLVQGKQTIFKFNYLFSFTGNQGMNVSVRLRLARDQWYTSMPLSRDDDPNYIFIDDTVELMPTPDGRPRTAYMFERYARANGTRGTWFPIPLYYPAILNVHIEVDPLMRITWDDRSVISLSDDFYVKGTHGVDHWIKIVLFQYSGFTSAERNVLRDLFFEPTPPVSPYEVYLSAMFPAWFRTSRHASVWMDGDIGWWDADTLAEEAADEGYSRVLAIVPDGSLGDGWIGVVYNADYYWFDQGHCTMFVEYDWAIDPGRQLYFPVVAHEFSHTCHMPDIYDGHRIVVDFDYVYFDEIQGGIIEIFKCNRTLTRGNIVRGRDLEPLPLPATVSGEDIMDHAGRPRDTYWAHASYTTVGRSLWAADPPEGLLVSMKLFKNGTVLARPFQKIFNHTFGYPGTEGTGNFSLVLYDRGGEVFRSYPFNISFYYMADPVGYVETDVAPIMTLVEWSDDLGRIELVDSNGMVLFTRSVSAHAPVLEVIYPPEGKKLGIGGNYTIAWNCTDADGDDLWYTVLMRKEGDQVWRSFASRIMSNRVSIIPSEKFDDPYYFEVGAHQIQIKATDGVNTAVQMVHVSIVNEVKMYTLAVDSSMGLTIQGSGEYEEGDAVTVKAPVEEPMKGLLGFLGGMYLFDSWKGAVESEDPEVIVPMVGEQIQLELTAVYDPDYSQVLIRLGGLILVFALVFVIAFKLRRKPQPIPPSSSAQT